MLRYNNNDILVIQIILLDELLNNKIILKLHLEIIISINCYYIFFFAHKDVFFYPVQLLAAHFDSDLQFLLLSNNQNLTLHLFQRNH